MVHPCVDAGDKLVARFPGGHSFPAGDAGEDAVLQSVRQNLRSGVLGMKGGLDYTTFFSVVA